MKIKKVFCSGDIKHQKNTPVYEALFSCYGEINLDDKTGQQLLTSPFHWPSPTWQQVKEKLIQLSEALGLSLGEESEGTLYEYILLLAKHFSVENTPEITVLEAYPFDLNGMPDMQILYYLALSFDDGHGVESIDFRGIWFNQKGDFGSYVVCAAKEINFYQHLNDGFSSAKFLDYLLSQNNIKRASEMMFAEVNQLFSKIQDEKKQSLIKSMVIDQLIDDV